MDIGIELAASVNLSCAATASFQWRFRDFSEDEFLLVRSHGLRIRSQRPRKPLVTCSLFDHGVLCRSYPIPRNGAVLLVGNSGVVWEERKDL